MSAEPKQWPMLAELAQPFPPHMVQEYEGRGYQASFVSHADVAQKLLAQHGPYSWEIIETIRESDGTVSGVVGKLTLEVDGRPVVISEVGEFRAKTHAERSAADRAKNASSDAFKRAAMRAGVGLHLWCDHTYALDRVLASEPEQFDQDPDDLIGGDQ